MERDYLGRIKGHIICLKVNHGCNILLIESYDFYVCSLMDESIDVSKCPDNAKLTNIFKPDIRLEHSYMTNKMIQSLTRLGMFGMFGMIREYIMKSVLSTVNKSAVLRGLQI
jgi:hypothetical protein